jgi:hypothetical protein
MVMARVVMFALPVPIEPEASFWGAVDNKVANGTQGRMLHQPWSSVVLDACMGYNLQERMDGFSACFIYRSIDSTNHRRDAAFSAGIT